MARLPTVGTKGLNLAQLPPRVRKILKHRADAASQREYAPVLAADRGEFGTAKKQYRAEAASARGATSAVQSSLAQALAGLKGAGLKGRYLQQTKNEFTSRAADAASSLPALLAGAAEDRNKALLEDRQNLVQDRAQMLQSGASKFNQTLKEERDAASSVLKERKKKAEPDKSELESLHNADLALKGFLSKWKQNISVEKEGQKVPIQEAFPLKSIAEWRTVAEELDHHQSGFDLTDAMKVIDGFIRSKKSKRAEHEGRAWQPGVPLGPRQMGG